MMPCAVGGRAGDGRAGLRRRGGAGGAGRSARPLPPGAPLRGRLRCHAPSPHSRLYGKSPQGPNTAVQNGILAPSYTAGRILPPRWAPDLSELACAAAGTAVRLRWKDRGRLLEFDRPCSRDLQVRCVWRYSCSRASFRELAWKIPSFHGEEVRKTPNASRRLGKVRLRRLAAGPTC
jgi:hypothetical protein